LIFLVSIFAAFGLAIAVFEFGDKPPVAWFVAPAGAVLRPLGLDGVFDCPACASFWCVQLTYAGMRFCPAVAIWPCLGFIALGLTWTIYRVMSQNQHQTAAAPP
jgi:hypothetical protein